jgi:hypothetical protein
MEVDLAYLISVFNTKRIPSVDPQAVRDTITSSNYHTLCDQYGLDPALIDSTLAHLNVIAEPYLSSGYFIVEYRTRDRSPIVVYLLDLKRLGDGELERICDGAPQGLQDALDQAAQIIQIELSGDQLSDLGLLLGYELARWAAAAGEGVILGLDGDWYRLNEDKAFLPVTE